MEIALGSFFRVGESGGKNGDRFDELIKCLQEDQPGDKIEHRKVFAEDRDFNQGMIHSHFGRIALVCRTGCS